MQVTRAHFDEAAERGIVSHAQGAALWDFFAQRDHDTPTFKAAHILYYLGGMVAIGAMTLFMTLGWERFHGGGLFAISVAYAVLALALTEAFLRRPGLAVPAGITAALAVVMIPLATYGAQHALGLWPEGPFTTGSYRNYHLYIDGRWIFLELATLLGAAIALWRYRLPFMVLPVAVTLWYMSMDLTPLLFGGGSEFFSPRARVVSMVFGAAMTLLALWVDVRSSGRKDFAFWLYVFGVMTFWGGLTSQNSDSELGKFIYACINLAMIATAAMLSRRVFAVFGAIGVAFYLGHLSSTIFRDSLMFPIALTAIGLLVIGSGIAWQRHEAALGTALRALLPQPLRGLVERRAAA